MKVINLKDIRAKYLRERINIQGKITKIWEPFVITIEAMFECPSCGTIINVAQNENKIRDPSRCPCGRTKKFKIISKKITDCQHIIIEELNINNPGLYPAITIILMGDLVCPPKSNLIKMGKKLNIFGELIHSPLKEEKSLVYHYSLLVDDILDLD